MPAVPSFHLLESGAPAGLVAAAVALLTKATGGAVRVVPTPSPSRAPDPMPTAAVVVGPRAPPSAFASVVVPPPRPSAAYAGLRTVVVRPLLPHLLCPAEGGAMTTPTTTTPTTTEGLRVRDRLDVFPAAGLDGAAVEAVASATFARAARLAIELAKEQGASRLTLVIKPATKYENLNNVFLRSATEVAEAAGLVTEVVHTAKAANELVVFPEKYAVVLTNDDPVCENLQRAFAGVIGGAPEVYYTESGARIAGGASYRSVALAVAQELKHLGLPQEAEKVLMAVARDQLKVEL